MYHRQHYSRHHQHPQNLASAPVTTPTRFTAASHPFPLPGPLHPSAMRPLTPFSISEPSIDLALSEPTEPSRSARMMDDQERLAEIQLQAALERDRIINHHHQLSTPNRSVHRHPPSPTHTAQARHIYNPNPHTPLPSLSGSTEPNTPTPQRQYRRDYSIPDNTRTEQWVQQQTSSSPERSHSTQARTLSRNPKTPTRTNRVRIDNVIRAIPSTPPGAQPHHNSTIHPAIRDEHRAETSRRTVPENRSFAPTEAISRTDTVAHQSRHVPIPTTPPRDAIPYIQSLSAWSTMCEPSPLRNEVVPQSPSRPSAAPPATSRQNLQEHTVNDDYEEDITCMICQDVMAAPLTLTPCGHGICGSCALLFIESQHNRHVKPSCPICRAEFPGHNWAVRALNVENVINRWLRSAVRRGWAGHQDWKDRVKTWEAELIVNPSLLTNLPLPPIPSGDPPSIEDIWGFITTWPRTPLEAFMRLPPPLQSQFTNHLLQSPRYQTPRPIPRVNVPTDYRPTEWPILRDFPRDRMELSEQDYLNLFRAGQRLSDPPAENLDRGRVQEDSPYPTEHHIWHLHVVSPGGGRMMPIVGEGL